VSVAHTDKLRGRFVRTCIDSKIIIDADSIMAATFHLKFCDVEDNATAWFCLNGPETLHFMRIVGWPVR